MVSVVQDFTEGVRPSADWEHGLDRLRETAGLRNKEGIEDENGVIFVRYPVIRLAEDISKSAMTVKRALKELEDRGLIFRIRKHEGTIVSQAGSIREDGPFFYIL